MKNKLIIIFTFLSTMVVGGSAFAVPATPNRTGSLTNTSSGTGYMEENNGVSGSESNRTDTASVGMTYYNKEGGVQIQTIIGVVESVNSGKNVFVVKHEGIITTVLTDSQTIAALHQGQTVRVKLGLNSPVALSVSASN